MQKDRSCTLVEQYLGYLITIKGRSNNTTIEYRTDLLQFFKYVSSTRGIKNDDYNFANLDFIRSITLADMYDTIFLNCALRLSELVAINLDQINSDVLTIIGKGNKERKFSSHLLSNKHCQNG